MALPARRRVLITTPDHGLLHLSSETERLRVSEYRCRLPVQFHQLHPLPQLVDAQVRETIETMAREGDVESQSNPHEETPLLNGEPSSPRVEYPESEPGRGSWSYWRLFWAVLAVVVAIVFIKGWIDAGSDVDVGLFATCNAPIYSQLTLLLAS